MRKNEIRAYIQRRDSILAWIVILSVYGADPIAEVKLLVSPFFCADLLIMKSIGGTPLDPPLFWLDNT
jgi:hypothetical protein